MNCPICNRPLKSKKSIERGIGPVCETKIAKLKEKENENQISFEKELSEER
ncbi:DUF6011 domain-containing protein [Heyndrickxia sporothermodurans]|uniref:DUF6011 domain-containing protein n=1 Tax=Heyndrickxia sporothermodurans TaxID=46224 RepID=UPI002DBE8B73|nr:DUF6011 domain-containing protein [Heyndrickxia sporothermodurans]MEB6549107.1 DUF6011 domain-containing protein [Heyndrickxia sporothermodurans]